MLDQNGQPIQSERPQQPSFPVTGINIPPDGSGMKVSVVLAPGVELSFSFGEEMMNQVTKQWVQTRKNIQDQLRAIQHVSRTRND